MTGATNGVFGITASGDPNAAGVYGKATSTSGSANGVEGATASANGNGVYGVATATSGVGVFGVATASSGVTYGVVGSTNSTSENASGVYGNTPMASTTGAINGVFGQTNSTDPNAAGVYGYASNGSGLASGVVGYSPNGDGLYGITSGSAAAGVVAYNYNTSSGEAQAIYSVAYSSNAAAGFFRNVGGGLILIGANTNSNVFYVDTDGDGYFGGNLHVNGTLSKNGGMFKIDDPLDPANKYLSHSFVESPDMMNIYNGIVRLDARGQAWVELPRYFQALNRDFRYQLTSIGASQPRLYIAREVSGNRFKIAGGRSNGKVSWMVTGVRQDAWANAHRIPNEEDKPADERGHYMHPELFGAPASQGIHNARAHRPAEVSPAADARGGN